MDWLYLFLDSLFAQLLFLQFGRLHLYASLGPIGSRHDAPVSLYFAICVEHAHECYLWYHDGCRND